MLSACHTYDIYVLGMPTTFLASMSAHGWVLFVLAVLGCVAEEVMYLRARWHARQLQLPDFSVETGTNT